MDELSPRLARALESLKDMPPSKQDEIAEMIEAASDGGDKATYVMSDLERADIADAIAEARRGEFATEAEVAATFARRRT